jgi:hypothetical protein
MGVGIATKLAKFSSFPPAVNILVPETRSETYRRQEVKTDKK